MRITLRELHCRPAVWTAPRLDCAPCVEVGCGSHGRAPAEGESDGYFVLKNASRIRAGRPSREDRLGERTCLRMATLFYPARSHPGSRSLLNPHDLSKPELLQNLPKLHRESPCCVSLDRDRELQANH